MRLLLNAGVLLLWITGHGAATELPQRSLDECIAFAIEHHPSLKAAQASVDAGGQRVWQVTSVYLPQVDANYNANRRQTSATATTGAEIGTITRTFSFYTTGFSLTQILFDFGQNLNRIRAAQAVEESLVADSLTQREAVIFNVKQAYFNVLAAKRLLNVADESVRQSESHLEQAQGRFDVGFAPRFDVTQSQVQLAQAQLNQVTARNTVRAARATLGNTLGLSGPPPFDVAEAFEARPVAVDEDQALAQAYEQRPEVLSLLAQQRSIEAEISALQKDYLPAVSGNATYFWAGTDYPLKDNWNVGAALNFSIFSGGLTTAQIGESKAILANLRFNTEALRQNVALQVREAVIDLREAGESIRVADKGVTLARENLELAEGRYATGAGSIIELTDAQASLTSAEASYVQAVYNYKIAVAALERATAADLGS